MIYVLPIATEDPKLLLAARYARRLRVLLRWVRHCWDASPRVWPLQLADLDAFAHSWERFEEFDAKDGEPPWWPLERRSALAQVLFRGVAWRVARSFQ